MPYVAYSEVQCTAWAGSPVLQQIQFNPSPFPLTLLSFAILLGWADVTPIAVSAPLSFFFILHFDSNVSRAVSYIKQFSTCQSGSQFYSYSWNYEKCRSGLMKLPGSGVCWLNDWEERGDSGIQLTGVHEPPTKGSCNSDLFTSRPLLSLGGCLLWAFKKWTHQQTYDLNTNMTYCNDWRY